MNLQTLSIDAKTAGELSRGVASVIPLIAEPAGDWLLGASDAEVSALGAACPEDPAGAWFSVFSHEVLPYQGVFLDAQSGQGWSEPRRIRSWIRQGAHSALSTGRTDDHLITLLEYACWLLNRCRSQEPAPHLLRLRELLDLHLLRWIPALDVALAHHDRIAPGASTAFYAAVGRLLTSRLCNVRAHLGTTPTGPERNEVLATGELHRDLLVPARCGTWLSRRILAGLCQQLGEAPRGERHSVSKRLLGIPGSRPLLVRELERAADDYSDLAVAFPQVRSQCESWQRLVLATCVRLR